MYLILEPIYQSLDYFLLGCRSTCRIVYRRIMTADVHEMGIIAPLRSTQCTKCCRSMALWHSCGRSSQWHGIVALDPGCVDHNDKYGNSRFKALNS